MKKGFTLAEIMIVLTVIAVLTAILLPSAQNAMPNEKVMKFKKGHNALYQAINELVTSDKYYLNGDLGTKINGDEVHQNEKANYKYFCETLADVMSVKYVNCSDSEFVGSFVFLVSSVCPASNLSDIYNNCNGLNITNESIISEQNYMDRTCKSAPFKNNFLAKQIIDNNNIWYWDNAPKLTFGFLDLTLAHRTFSPPKQNPAIFHDSNGNDILYKVICMDIDGVPDNATTNDCVNECPFGYGVRADGKILNGARADEWLNKTIQEK